MPAGTRSVRRAANAGVQIVEVGTGGMFTREQFEAAIKPAGFPVFPSTTVVEIENTHNRAGGIVFPQDEVVRICAFARERGIASFLDGARLWNAAVASGRSEAELAAPFDLVSVAFSKGLGAPAGSLLAGPLDSINAANRQRRRLGGAMRQVGILAAAALHGVRHHRARLADDHANARRLATSMANCAAVQLDLASVQTNIVVFQLQPARRMRPAWWRRRGSRACCWVPSARARCARSRTWTCRPRSATTRRCASCHCWVDQAARADGRRGRNRPPFVAERVRCHVLIQTRAVSSCIAPRGRQWIIRRRATRRCNEKGPRSHKAPFRICRGALFRSPPRYRRDGWRR